MRIDGWFVRRWIGLASYVAVAAQSSNTSSVSPLSIPASLYWDGDDGQWSTFQIQVGTPGQTVRLLPGTSATSATCVWVVISEGCADVNPSLTNCDDERGYLFQSNASTSWSTQGLANVADGAIYSLSLYEEGILGIEANASYGHDTIALGIPGSGLPTLNDQLIAGIWTNDFFLGSLGLSPIPTNFSNLNDPQPSLVGSLRNKSLIPSSSWGYTAGAYYNDVFGSLTLGGYDTTRFQANNASFSFGPDFSRDLVVGLQSITYDTAGSTPLLARSIDIFIDSLVTELWLPVDVCDTIAERFNLTWNEQGQVYLVSEAAYTALSQQKPTFTFTIGQPSTGSQNDDTVDIVLPYAAFDLNLTAPVVSNGTTARYFPLKQAQNATQYTLGRAFLQEAYVIADYDRRNFSVSQALFPSTSTDQDIVTITAPGEDGSESEESSPQASGGGLGAGAIAGLVIGVVAAIGLVAGTAFFLMIRRRKRRASPTDGDALAVDERKDRHEVAGEDQQGVHEAENAQAQRHEMAGTKTGLVHVNSDRGHVHELASKPTGHELGTAGMFGVEVHEMAGQGVDAHEMDVREFPAHELEAPLR